MSSETPQGYLIIKVSTASGAIPVEDATVIVQGKDADNQDILISLLTDRDGLTKRVALPSPSRDLSSAPSPASKPYSSYSIDVYKDGYYPQHYNGAPIFEGITAVQNARIIPISEFDAKSPYYADGQIFNESENTDL